MSRRSAALRAVQLRYSPDALAAIAGGATRFNRIRDASDVNHRVLKYTLEALEAAGLVTRVLTAKEVMFRLTALGAAANEFFWSMRKGRQRRASAGRRVLQAQVSQRGGDLDG